MTKQGYQITHSIIEIGQHMPNFIGLLPNGLAKAGYCRIFFKLFVAFWQKIGVGEFLFSDAFFYFLHLIENYLA